MLTICVDPGLRVAGLAVYSDSVLTQCMCITNPNPGRGPKAWIDMANAIARELPHYKECDAQLVVEQPQVYIQSARTGDPADLLELAGVNGAIAGIIPPVKKYIYYLPRQWKGSCPKQVHNVRVMKKLSEAEKTRLIDIPKTILHNAIDSAGLGLFHLGR